MRRRGFTLLEILIALTMVGTILTLVYTTFSTTSRTIRQRETHARALHRANFILRHITDHLQSVYLDAAAYYRLEDPLALFEGGGNALGFWTQSPPQTRRLTAGALQHMEYRVRPMESGDGEALELACEAYADTTAPGDEPMTSWSVPVESVSFEYHDGVGWTGGWDIEAEARLPRAVRITVSVLSGSGTPMQLQSAVPLPVTGLTELEPDGSAEPEAATPELEADATEEQVETPRSGKVAGA